MKPVLTPDEFRNYLRLYIKDKYKTQLKAAKALGVSNVLLSYIVTGARNPSKKLLKTLGYEKVQAIAYRKLPGTDAELEDDVRKLVGLPPYNHPANLSYADGLFARSLIKKYGKDRYKKMLAHLKNESELLKESL